MDIKELANLCGVSVATVSRVFNEPEKVRESTRELVLSMAKKYGYSPHSVAKSLRKRFTGLFLLAVLSEVERVFEDSYTSKFLKGAVGYFSENNLKLVVDVVNPNKTNVIEYYRSLVLSKMIDGVILMDLKDDDERVELLNELQFPYVCVGRNNRNNFIYVDSDNYNGGYIAAEHFLSLRRKKLLFVGGDPTLPFERDRRNGFFDGCKGHGDITIVEEYGYYDEKKVKEILEIYQGKFDGIFCTSDVMAYAALRFCERNGIDVPIVGFDNIHLSEIANLTTVDQHIEVVGTKAAEKLYRLSRGQKVDSELISTELIVRGTKRFLIP
ncbi:MAG: LacI family DNA-binding transcriptional regulator [Fervidobacterium sp.]|uniref:Transcriptional regulator, LacI family n=1 Tax=Fervidobacterium gondwanense DSM 13020 TaxID=1121883 RepID=A0A1M7SPN6_FERGO|nr:LacI family DNA-binding transcriptional regulator [Fervidobacterium gondwanense]SHN60349.1 transcriptional regulator, LacI family [Fervidobacterium gondwanense DSM 13020]